MSSQNGSLTPHEVERINGEFEDRPPEAVLEWALKQYQSRIALSSSFGAEDVALIDMLWRIDPKARVFTLDTLRLHTQTYDVMDRIRGKYGIDLEIMYPDLKAVDAMVKENGYNLFYGGIDFRKLCCGIRKVVPLEQALAGLDAWITGLRRDQGVTRTQVQKVELDEVHGNMVKINPLADWSSDQVWEYICKYEVPYNELHDQGFPSIGCEPCTRAIEPGEDPRAGRWWWELDPGSKECGIHIGGAIPTSVSLTGLGS